MSRSASGSTITIADAAGTELDSFQAAQVSQNIVISGMVTGEMHTVSVDGQQAAEVVAGQGGSATGPGGMQGGVPGQRPGQVPGQATGQMKAGETYRSRPRRRNREQRNRQTRKPRSARNRNEGLPRIQDAPHSWCGQLK